MIRARVAVAVAVAVGAIFAGPPAPARASSPPRTVACRVRADPAAVAGAAELRRLNAVADRLSPGRRAARPSDASSTGSNAAPRPSPG